MSNKEYMVEIKDHKYIVKANSKLAAIVQAGQFHLDKKRSGNIDGYSIDVDLNREIERISGSK